MNLKVLTLSLIITLVGCGKKSDDTAMKVVIEDRTTPQRTTIVDDKSQKELSDAILSNDSLLVDYALEENETIDYLFVDGETPLTKAIKNANNIIISKLITKSNNLNLKNARNETPLNIAIRNKKINIIHSLIDNNADINLLGHNGMSPLSNAIFFCNETEAIQLVRKGADINSKFSGITMLELADQSGYSKLFKLIQKASQHKSVNKQNILRAIQKEDESFIKYLITRFPEYISIINDENMLLDVLDLDNEIKRVFILKYLLESGAAAHNENGKTPLIYTVEKNLPDEMNTLLLRGADINYNNSENKDALIISVENLHFKITEKLHRILKEETNNVRILMREQAIIDFKERMNVTCRYLPYRRAASSIIRNGKNLRKRTRILLKCGN